MQTRGASPRKRIAERTTTITVPLKGGDDSPPVETKKGRKNQRQSLNSSRRRSGTPKPAAGNRQRTISNDEERSGVDDPQIGATPPKRGRGRPRKSIEPSVEKAKDDKDSQTGVAADDGLEMAMVGRKTSRSRNRGRRKEISPMKIGSDFDSSLGDGGVPVEADQYPSEGPFVTSLGSNHAQMPDPQLEDSVESSPVISADNAPTKDKEPSQILPETYPPSEDNENLHEQPPTDPTDEHQEFDTILESEGFSMVSVSSLASTEGSARVLDDLQDMQREHTPAIEQSPAAPPEPGNEVNHTSPRQLVRSQDGTPKLARVVRAGIALQGVLSPAERVQRLASPLADRGQSSSFRSDTDDLQRKQVGPSITKANSPIARLDNLFSGFGAGTRRELRAGLRLGEELAKRQRQTSSSPNSSVMDDDVFRGSSHPQYPQLPGFGRRKVYELKLPNPMSEQKPEVAHPLLSRAHLPTPDRSDEEADDDRMKSMENTSNQLEVAVSPPAVSSDASTRVGHNESTIDYTMLAREAGWQREREANIRQIEMANESQVIVINSDDEDLDLGDDESDDEDEDEGDIWAAEAHSTSNTREATPEVSDLLLKPELVKPQRSKLPSPWRRSSGLIYSDDVVTTHSEISGQDSPNEAEEVSSDQSIGSPNESTNHLDASSATVSYDEDQSNSSIISGAQDPPYLVASAQHYNDESSMQREDSTGLLLANQLNTVRTKPDKPGSVRKDSKSVLDDAIRAHKHHLETKQQISERLLPSNDNSRFEYTNTVQNFGTDTVKESSVQPGEGITVLIDPFLLEAPKQRSKPEPHKKLKPSTHPPPLTILPSTISHPTTWLTYLTKSFLTTSTPTLPPPATRSDILISSPHEPLSQITPWTSIHTNALGPLYYSSLLYGSHLFSYDPNSPAARFCGLIITSRLGWQRRVSQEDCAVADAFAVLLDERGYALAEGVTGERWMNFGDAIKQCVELWVGMCMRGEVVPDEKGANGRAEKVGKRRQGDRKWNEGDVEWNRNQTRYFERKRKQFDGLPSWKEAGWRREGEGWVLYKQSKS